MIFALALISSTHAQTITNVGYGIAGNGITATTQAYNIDITEDGSCIAINGTYWPVFADNTSSPFTHVVKWDAVKSRYVPFGMIKAMTYDGTQFLSGIISIRTSPRMKVVSFKAFKVYTPKPMPILMVSNDITVYQRWTGLFIEQPQLTIKSTTTRGALWINADYTEYAAVLDNGGNLFIYNGGKLTVVPGPSGPTVPELLPYKVR